MKRTAICQQVSMAQMLPMAQTGKAIAFMNDKSLVLGIFSEDAKEFMLSSASNDRFGFHVQIQDGPPVQMRGLHRLCRKRKVDLSWSEVPESGIEFTSRTDDAVDTLIIRVSDPKLWDIVHVVKMT